MLGLRRYYCRVDQNKARNKIPPWRWIFQGICNENQAGAAS
jgi:hypothetical protein